VLLERVDVCTGREVATSVTELAAWIFMGVTAGNTLFWNFTFYHKTRRENPWDSKFPRALQIRRSRM